MQNLKLSCYKALLSTQSLVKKTEEVGLIVIWVLCFQFVGLWVGLLIEIVSFQLHAYN